MSYINKTKTKSFIVTFEQIKSFSDILQFLISKKNQGAVIVGTVFRCDSSKPLDLAILPLSFDNPAPTVRRSASRPRESY